MEGLESGSSAQSRYKLKATRIPNEDILFCIDVDPESNIEMKITGPNGRPITRLDAIKQAVLLFMNAKLSMNPDHRFALCALGRTNFWIRKEFNSDFESARAAVSGLSANDSASGQADLTHLFRAAAHEAKKSKAHKRLFRVILIYCRSSVQPHHQWPINQKIFTLDIMYLHDKPGHENCPQKVYDVLVDTLEQVSECEGYIFESGQGLARVLFRHMCVLLSHPLQRCIQDEIEIPKSLSKKSPAIDAQPGEDINAPASTQ